MSKVLVYLISGKAGVGKTFSKSVLQDMYTEAGYRVVALPFAKKVKDVATLMGWDGKKTVLGRELLQSIGKCGRAYNENLWVDSVISSIHEMEFYPDVVLVDDWRFPNEYMRFSTNSPMFKVVSLRIVSPERESLLKFPELYFDDSETSLDTFAHIDYSIENPINPSDKIFGYLEEIASLETLKNRR